jgi:hypothetical protein
MMWIVGAFTAVIGFLRGWNQEIIVAAAAVLAAFVIFQFDSLIRGTLLAAVPHDQVFLLQAAAFLLVVYLAYKQRFDFGVPREREGIQSGILGALVGFVNGYLIMGTLWYFLDINEYPLAPLITAPGPNSPSAQSLSSIPLVILSGGVTGSGDFLVIVVIALFLLVLLSS